MTHIHCLKIDNIPMNLTESALKNHLLTANYKVFDIAFQRDPKNGIGLRKGFLKTNKHGCLKMSTGPMIVEGSRLRFEPIHKIRSSLHPRYDPQPIKLIVTTDIPASTEKE